MYKTIEVLPLYSEVLPKLFIGGTDDRDVISNPNRHESLIDCTEFESVVTLYAYANPKGWHVAENRYGFPDSALSLSDMVAVRNLADWLHKEWRAGKNALARCQAGLNRSSLIIALVLLLEGYSSQEAIELIRARRSEDALFNKSFVAFIHAEYESRFKDSAFAA